jgi:hypothetical protein
MNDLTIEWVQKAEGESTLDLHDFAGHVLALSAALG